MLPPPPEFPALVALLAGRRGADQAITIAESQAALALPNRRATEKLLELSMPHFPWPVCSGTTGYFRPVTAEEMNHYEHSLRSRAACLYLRLRHLRRAGLQSGWRRERKRWVNAPNQLDLGL